MKRIKALFMTVLLLCLTGCGEEGILLSQDAEPVQVRHEAASEDSTEAALSDETIYAYVCGEVEVPGVYPMPPHSRIYELVEAAGGMTEDAVPDSVNLAQELTDGQMINIPSRETADRTGVSLASEDREDGMININTAPRERLMTLNGIGEAKADAIIAYREQNGPFSQTEDLLKVDGIGQGIFAKIKDKVIV